MSLNKGKHNIEEINGETCTLVEDIATQERVDFLKKLLEFNGYKVEVTENEGEEKSFRIGVADLIFNPVVDVYKRRLYTPSGHHVTPAYWLQLSSNETEAEVNYWSFKPDKK